MKYIDEFRNPALCKSLIKKIEATVPERTIQLMEVCGTHTMSIFRHGIRDILPDNLRMLSGPGCPVCVTPNSYIDRAIACVQLPDVIIATFGDMIRVPGSSSNLGYAKSEGCDVRVVYSPLDALKIAKQNPNSRIVFLGVGFETTSPSIAITILNAAKEGINNYYVLPSLRTIPQPMCAILKSEDVQVDGFLLPGHVSTIIGYEPYRFLVDEFRIPCVIGGFEPLDVLMAVFMLTKQISEGRAEVENEYQRVVKPEGNKLALKKVEQVFQKTDIEWRGLGIIENSGLKIRPEYAHFDAFEEISVEVEPPKEHIGCICGDILRGAKTPLKCKLFRNACTPRTPVGPCMVSSEGTCAAYYKYGER